MHLIEVFARTLAAFITLLIATRILGKKQISQLNYFNYVTGIAFGTTAGSFAWDRRIPLTEGLTSLFGWTLFTFIAGYCTLKSSKARSLFSGHPTYLIKKGVLQKSEMASLRLSLEDLRMLLRTKGTFSIGEVDYAILELNGELSVLVKPEHQTPTQKDLKLHHSSPDHLPMTLIVDGNVMQRNLRELKLDFNWLEQQLREHQIHSAEDVFYAELQSDGKLFIQ